MTTSLTPLLALAYLRELSLDIRGAVVLDASGEPVAGDAALAPRARDLLASAPGASATAGPLHVARAADGGAIAVLAGDFAIVPLLDHDLATTATALATGRVEPPGS